LRFLASSLPPFGQSRVAAITPSDPEWGAATPIEIILKAKFAVWVLHQQRKCTAAADEDVVPEHRFNSIAVNEGSLVAP